jgi:CRP-like cAMP-binding protein/DNA-binding NarL/FixJ family response regulator
MAASILVIDDNKDIRENTAEILDLAGYKTFTAENGKKGVEIALKEKPSLIVCDIMMPELDGYGVLHLIRKNHEIEHTPFIFLTAKTERNDFRKGMEMGADDYITKPFEEIELLNAVEIRLKKSAILHQNYETDFRGLSQLLTDVKDMGLVRHLSEKYDTENYSRKQTLYHEGKKPRFLFYLVKGKVKGLKTNQDGKEYITNLYSTGDFIGYSALLENSSYEDSAVVIEDAEILSIPKEDFLQMVYNEIGIASKFIHIITKNVKEKEDRLLSLAYNSLRKRVATALVEITNKFNLGELTMPIEISREEIAQYVGTATESLIRTLSDFKAEKLININNGKIVIKNIEKLKNLIN